MTGWQSLPFVDIDGQDWPVPFAAELLEIPEEDLRDLIRILRIEPSGVIRMSDFRRQGRQPRAYPAKKMIRISEAIATLAEELAENSSLSA